MPEKHNITIIGPTKSGKTQIVNRLAGKPFVEPYKVRVGLNPVRKDYKDQDIQIEYLDVGPNILSEQINNALVRSSKICLVFDATDPQWMQTLDGYLTTKGIVIPDGTQLLILGNKVDLLTKEQQSAVEKRLQRPMRRGRPRNFCSFPQKWISISQRLASQPTYLVSLLLPYLKKDSLFRKEAPIRALVIY